MWHVWAAEKLHPGFWWGDPREGEHLQDLGIERLKIIKWFLNNWGWGGTDWIDTAEGGGRWRALVNVGIKFRGP
jgi:hypothetical protein